MKTMLGLLMLLMLPGCAELGAALKMSKAPLICAFATAPKVEQATKDILSDVPEGKDKDKAELILRVTKLSADAGCVAAKAVEAEQTTPAQ